MIQRDAVDARLAGKQIGGAEVRGGAGKLETRRQRLGIRNQLSVISLRGVAQYLKHVLALQIGILRHEILDGVARAPIW